VAAENDSEVYAVAREMTREDERRKVSGSTS
jgi:hypothetical protein